MQADCSLCGEMNVCWTLSKVKVKGPVSYLSQMVKYTTGIATNWGAHGRQRSLSDYHFRLLRYKHLSTWSPVPSAEFLHLRDRINLRIFTRTRRPVVRFGYNVWRQSSSFKLKMEKCYDVALDTALLCYDARKPHANDVACMPQFIGTRSISCVLLLSVCLRVRSITLPDAHIVSVPLVP